MRCGRCRSDTRVEKWPVDGYVGYLCGECRKVWRDLTEARTGP